MEMPPSPAAGSIETEDDVVVDVFVLVFLDVPVVVEPLAVSSLAVLVLVEVSVSLEDLVEVWEATVVVCSEVDAVDDVDDVVDSSRGQCQGVRKTRE